MEKEPKVAMDKTEAIQDNRQLVAEDIQQGLEIDLRPRLRIIRKINEGGMGVVWHAKLITEIEQDVAIKLAKPGFSDELRREAEYVEHLSYRTIAKLLGVTKIAGETALIMEYVSGKNFYEIIQMHNSLNRIFPERFAGFVGWLVCEALNHVHNLSMTDNEGIVRIGLLHGDMSPQNIIAESSGGIKITDYGTSRALGEKKGYIVTGKFPYLPPEIVLGAEPNCSSDIYSLGATLYHLAFGNPAFSMPRNITDKISALTYVKRLHESGELEKKVEDDTLSKGIISREIGEVIFCAMRKDPLKRHQSAGEMKDNILDSRLALAMKKEITRYLYGKGFGPTQEALGKYLEMITRISEGRPTEHEELEEIKAAMPYLVENGNLVLKKKRE